MKLFPENHVSRYWKCILLWMVVRFFRTVSLYSSPQPAPQPSYQIIASVFGLFWRAVCIVWWWFVRKSKAMKMQCRCPNRREKRSPAWGTSLIPLAICKFWRLQRVLFSIMRVVEAEKSRDGVEEMFQRTIIAITWKLLCLSNKNLTSLSIMICSVSFIHFLWHHVLGVFSICTNKSVYSN